MKQLVKRILAYLRVLDKVAYLIDGHLRNFQLAHYKQFWHYRWHGTPDGQPLPCTAEKFSFLYARSVFTHLPEALQFAWLSEVHRVLQPVGVFLFTVSGDFFRPILTMTEQQQYDSGSIVIRDAAFEGQNACAAFHPRAYVQEVWPQMGFELLDFIPGGTVPFANQDTWLARKRN